MEYKLHPVTVEGCIEDISGMTPDIRKEQRS